VVGCGELSSHLGETTVVKKSKKCENKMCEMQKVSEVFKSYLNYYQRGAHKKSSLKTTFF
jgi:hypothetical protein